MATNFLMSYTFDFLALYFLSLPRNPGKSSPGTISMPGAFRKVTGRMIGS